MVQIKPASGAEGHSQEMATPGGQAASARLDTTNEPIPLPLSGIFEEDTTDFF